MALFTTRLREYVARSGLTVRQLNEKTGIGGMSMLLIGKRTPPLGKIDALADALGITDQQERDQFGVLALLAHCPIELENMFLGLFTRTAELERQLAVLEQRKAELDGITAERDRQAAELAALRAEVERLRKAKRTGR